MNKRIIIGVVAASMLASCAVKKHEKVIVMPEPVAQIEKPLIEVNPELRYDENIPFLTNTSYKLDINPLPSSFSKDVSIKTMVMTSRDIIELINNEVSIPVSISSNVSAMILDRKMSPISDMTLNYTGSLRGALDVITMKLGVSWDYVDGRVNIFKYKTKNYTLPMIPGDNSERVLKIKSTLSKMISYGGKFEVDSASSTISIIDTPDVISRVDEYISYKKHQMMKQVLVKVNIYKVTRLSSEKEGFSWGMVSKSIGQGYGGVREDALMSKSPDNVSGDIAVFDLSSSDSNINDSGVFLKALETQGDVSIVTSTSSLMMNMQKTPISRMANNEGVSLSIIPVVMDNNNIVIQLSMEYSKLLSINVDEDGVQTPNIGHDKMVQRVVMHSGQMVAIGGLETNSYTRLDTGIGAHKHKKNDGRMNGKSIKDIFIVTLTPTLVTL